MMIGGLLALTVCQGSCSKSESDDIVAPEEPVEEEVTPNEPLSNVWCPERARLSEG